MEGYDVEYSLPTPRLMEQAMGLLDALFGLKKTKVKVELDRVWMTTETKFAEVQYDLRTRTTKSAAAVLLVAHFDDVRLQLESITTEEFPVPVRLVRASDLNPSVAAEMDLESASIDIICADRHPVYSIDQSVSEFAEALSCKCRVIRHMSFEDALIRRFVDPDLIRRLGIRDTESLQNGMISRRIRSAQRRVESLTVTNIPADSAEEWFQANCPEMKPVVN